MTDIDNLPTNRRGPTLVLRSVGVLLQLGVLVVLLAGGLVAPPWAVAMGAGVWLVSLVPFVWALRRRPAGAPLVALAVLAVWVLTVTVGDVALGWTA